ncbi:MAG: hypothetical protein OEZ29_05610 [Candidatus Bathyarchaeota archaeon]|nr:hypothetical protein [Candidatus Bathyarchaeota archaeon]MDH5780053.1 hypothetical protein [Candidatus Bathyarchaeota archaeon]
MAETLEIPLKELKTWLEEETSSTLEPIRAEGTNLLNNARTKLQELGDSSEKMLETSEKEMLKNSPKTYRRARTAYKLARDVLEALDELDITDNITHESLRILCDNLEKTLVAIDRERARRFRQISPYFIFDRRRFDSALKKTADSFKELQDFSLHGYARAKAMEDSIARIGKLSKSIDALDKVEKQKSQVNSRTKDVEKKISETERRIASIGSEDEVSELAQTRQEIEELEKSLTRNLRHLEKPFVKFQKLVQSPAYRLPLSETKKLSQYMQNPFEALATEEKGYPQLRTVIQGMIDAIAKGKLRLKKSRWRKAQEQIKEILDKNSLTALHESCSEAFSKRQRLLASEAVAVSRRRRTKLERNLDRLEKQKKLADSRLAVLERRYNAELEDIENQRKDLENAVFEITDKMIKVTL